MPLTTRLDFIGAEALACDGFALAAAGCSGGSGQSTSEVSSAFPDIGILASADPVAFDRACVDLVYASDDDSADLIERIESRGGEHVLEHAEKIGLGSRSYRLIEIEG